MNFSGRGHGRGHGRGYGYGYDHPYYGYAPYGYSPYGYGVPVAPAVGLTEEQQKAIADQQAQMIENMQKAQQQAAEFYAKQPVPAFGAQPTMFEDPFIRQMDAEHEARIKEMDARMEEARKAADLRRKEAEERFKARRQERTASVDEKAGA
jgi:hypothetical protein